MELDNSCLTESANLHYKHQQQLVDQSSSPLATPFYESEAAHAAWTPNSILNSGDFNPNINMTNSMTQDMGFGSFTGLSAHDHDLQLTRIKDELSSSSSSSDHHSNYPKITNMLNISSSSSSIEDSHLLNTSSNSYIKNEQRNLLRNFSSGCQINGYQLPATGGLGGFYSNSQQQYCPTSALSDTNTVARGTFSQIFPTINISDLNQTASSNSSAFSSSSLDMNLEALDLFNSSRFSTGFSQSSPDHLGLFKSCSLPSYNLDNIQLQLSPRTSNCPSNVSPFNNGVQEVKRSSSSLETKSPQAAPKKSRLDSRSTCPPFKVRKEKLGDRIAALQQLVAPFGKTDTASVLMEAIGYIKFLQNQVETLSVPYMKSSRNRTRKIQGGLGENAEEDGTRDLRTRGLCLVPLSCLSYITEGGGGGGVWPPPPHYGGGS